MPADPREVWGDLATSAFIEASILFKSLDEAAREDLLKLARRQAFAPGEPVAGGGAVGGDDLFLVQSGTAAFTIERAGQRIQVGTLARGAYFGEAPALGEAAPSLAVVAVSDLDVVRFPAPIVAVLAERFPRLRKLLEALREAHRREAG